MDTALKKARLAARWIKALFAKGYTKVQTQLVTAGCLQTTDFTDWHRLIAKGSDQDDY